MAEAEKHFIPEKDLALTTLKGESEYEDPEYTEYLALTEEYSGDKLKKLQVSDIYTSLFCGRIGSYLGD